MPHPDLASERTRLHDARAALAAMAARTEGALADVSSAATETDSEVSRWHLRRRLTSLAEVSGIPAFGRIDTGEDRFYVGRRHIEDDSGEALVVDWRAPVSVPFYRATLRDPLDLDRRRRFTSDGDELVDIIEEDFTDPNASAAIGGIPDPLLAELDRERTATMRDIVATIAAEQDEVIRAPLDRLLVVQGGPGTGKTAVALHRAAFLLFEHRDRLHDTGVLVIGPNPVFLRYVADVLPSLGEVAVRQTTIEGLRPPSIRLADEDDDEVARVKGDARMAIVIDRAVRSSIRLPEDTVVMSTARGTVRIDPDTVASIVTEILSRHVPHATGKESVRTKLVHAAYAVHERTAEVPALKTDFVAAVRSDTAFRRFMDRTWPSLSAPKLVQQLLGTRSLRRRATEGVLAAHEADLLARTVAPKIGDERWSPADVALLDEAEARINGAHVGYGHIVADEAQDLSPMALRMLARRSSGGSMTVVGDLAQGTRPWAAASWDDVIAVVASSAPVQRAELTVGYRTPASILDLANRLLPIAAPDVTPARSIRGGGEAPTLLATTELDTAAAAEAADGARGRGTVAVIAVASRRPGLSQALDAAGVDWGSAAAGLGTVALVSPLLAKGLEFDTVVVVEPAEIIDAEPAGHRALFVALTRPTQRLVVVHDRPLPPVLRG